MTDADLAAVCWVRAVEQGARDGVPWSDDDARWASTEARRAVGDLQGDRADSRKAQGFVVQRALLAQRRLAEHNAAWKLPLPQAGPRAWRWLLLAGAVAIAAFIVGNVIGESRRINLLAPPVLGLLLWNGLVYALLLVAAGRGPSGWLAQAIDEARTRFSTRGVGAPLIAARARFAAEWAVATRGVQQQRVAVVMHAAAALLAALVVASMYVFGLAFDFRAGWDSTWLDAEQVQRTLALVFTPATALSGLAVPGIDEMAKLRFAEGGEGERAGRWIHLYAITLALVVIVPRLLLAAWSAWRVRRVVRQLALPLDEPYFRALLRDGPALTRPVAVLPYSYALGAAQAQALPKALVDVFGPGVQPRLQATLPLGAEDDLSKHLPSDAAPDVAALFAATATPERETHGAFVRALQNQLGRGVQLTVLVDESGLKQRTGQASDAELRLTQRRAAWQRMLHDLSLPAPRFVDLG